MKAWTFGGDPLGEYELVATPATDPSAVASALGVQAGQILLTRVFRTTARGPALASGVDPTWALAVIRGDQTLDLQKLSQAVREHFQVDVIPEEYPTAADRFELGYVGPHAAMKAPEAVLIVDPAAAQNGFWIAGGNEPCRFVRNFNWFRECGDRLADPRKTAVAEIAR